jgi:hypothetical protein
VIALTTVEVWRDGTHIRTRTVPNLNAARVYAAQQKAAGFRTLLVHTRTETERAL